MRTLLPLSIALLALPLTLAAQPPRQGPPLERLTERVLGDPEIREAADLEDEQVEALRDLVHGFQAFQIENRAARDLARLALDRLWESDEPDAEAIHAAIDEQRELAAALQHRAADLRLAVREVITTEQREKIEQALRERVRDRRGALREGRGQERGGWSDREPRPRPPQPPMGGGVGMGGPVSPPPMPGMPPLPQMPGTAGAPEIRG